MYKMIKYKNVGVAGQLLQLNNNTSMKKGKDAAKNIATFSNDLLSERFPLSLKITLSNPHGETSCKCPLKITMKEGVTVLGLR